MELKVGEIVLANWKHDEFWYPAIIMIIEGEKIYVRFFDGDKEWTTEDNLMVMDIEVGDRVYCRWQGGSYYYPGRITQIETDKYFVHYDDGDEEWSELSFIRVTR